MVLCIDVENSDITLGGFRDSELAFIAKLSTAVSETEDEYAVKILNILALRGVDKDEIKGVIIASVVPQLNSVVIGAVKLLYGLEPIVVGPGVKSGINIHCDTPSSVGADLICASVAAYTVYGGTSLIVDM
ncbi:MAG: type III pantothenate kinase [Clostridia bacterium]|nr:type III pantothenate kinase [Clostridia bacterium]